MVLFIASFGQLLMWILSIISIQDLVFKKKKDFKRNLIDAVVYGLPSFGLITVVLSGFDGVISVHVITSIIIVGNITQFIYLKKHNVWGAKSSAIIPSYGKRIIRVMNLISLSAMMCWIHIFYA